MHTVFALLCFVVVIHWLIFPYPSGLLHWHCGNLTIAPVPAKQPWWIWINTSCELIMTDCITTTKQSTTKPCAYFLGYTVIIGIWWGYTSNTQRCCCVIPDQCTNRLFCSNHFAVWRVTAESIMSPRLTTLYRSMSSCELYMILLSERGLWCVYLQPSQMCH